MAAVTTRSSASASPGLHSTTSGGPDASLFPLKSIADVVNFFRRSLQLWSTQGIEPDLTLLSIVAGFIELSLTTGEAAAVAAAQQQQTAAGQKDVVSSNSIPFPVVTHELVSGLYKKFQGILAVVERPKTHSHNRSATREIIKKVSDVIWHSLIRRYKDRAHLQNLYSFLSANKLDCFGVAFAVVAGCQMLGYRDVHLAIAEDHAWVVFGGSGGKRLESIEVTWHGKGAEDKRGQDISAGVESSSWLYLGGLPVICDRAMEVAAIVSAINISLTANSDCVEVADLQQQLLWLLYDMNLLQKYPMALGTLGELEEISPTPDRRHISCDQLYRESMQSAREHYSNHHVYPYTYTGNYYYRVVKYREAFAAWANAADVIRLYTYNCRDDEEIYKELLDIANEMIPYVMKTESSGHSARSILRDSEVFANLLRFYDGVCQWEEDSPTPILHIGWAKPLVNNITKFDYDIRRQVVIKVPEDEHTEGNVASQVGNKHDSNETTRKEHLVATGIDATTIHNNNNNSTLLSVKREEKHSDGKKLITTEIPTTLADLTAACGEKILNPDFLLQGGGQPFAEQHHHNNNNHDEAKKQERNKNSIEGNNITKSEANDDTNESSTLIIKSTVESAQMHRSAVKAGTSTAAIEKNGSTNAILKQYTGVTNEFELKGQLHEKLGPVDEDPFEFMHKRPVITLYSQKMKGLKDLLLAEKLNTHAISLQVTAQSVASKKVRGIDKLGNHTTSSIYATVNVTAAAPATSGGGSLGSGTSSTANTASTEGIAATTGSIAESIAASRPKRSRRE